MKRKTKSNMQVVAAVSAELPGHVGQMVYSKDSNKLFVCDGKAWHAIDHEIRYCLICKGADWSHHNNVQHPFIGGNLELLEYKYGQRHESKA